LGRKKKRDAWDTALEDPLFYIPFIGPLLHGVKHYMEEADEDSEEEEGDEEEDED
jgi:hypothetical protein